MSDESIEYVGIPGEDGKGVTMLSIYPPGTWFDSKDYHVFVGGSGWGSRPTLKEAEALLLKCAKEYCTQMIRDAERQLGHYLAEHKRLTDVGLKRRG